MVTKTVQHQCHNHIGFLLINSGPDQVKHDTVSASYDNIPQVLIWSRCGQVVSKWPSFHWKHTKPKAISTTKMASPHDQLNSFSIPMSVSSTKCSMIQNTWHQNKMAIYLVSVFTDAYLRYAAFELLKSVDTQGTNLQSKFLPCNLLVKQGTSRLTTIFIVRRAGLLWSQQDFEWRWSVPLFKCLTVLEFSYILFDLCLLITFFNFIMNYVPIVTFWIFTYHKIWIFFNYVLFYMKLLNYLFFSMFGSVLESCELTGVCLLLPWLIKWK